MNEALRAISTFFLAKLTSSRKLESSERSRLSDLTNSKLPFITILGYVSSIAKLSQGEAKRPKYSVIRREPTLP